MKIKKIFGLVSIASLGILMTACSKSGQNESIYGRDMLDLNAITKEDYKEKIKNKVEAITVFKDETVYQTDETRGIIVTYDDTNYYVYNLKLENKKIITLQKEYVSNISLYGTNEYIYIRHKTADSVGNYAYSAYLFDGTILLDNVICTSTISASIDRQESILCGLNEYKYIKRFKLTYHTKDNSIEKTNILYYYAVYDDNNDGSITKDTVIHYYLENDFLQENSNVYEKEYDGAIVGLEGYTIKNVGNKMYIYKNDKLKNVISYTGTYVSDGYVLSQKIRIVNDNEKYDFFFDGKYYVVDTYKIDLLTSKISEVKNFNYYIYSSISTIYEKDTVGNKKMIKGYLVNVYDFSGKKQLTSADLKTAYIKGNGDIKINEGMKINDLTSVIEDGGYYYSYNTTTNKSSTIINDKKGNIVDVYSGTYFDGINVNMIVNTSSTNNKTNFTDKDNNVILELNNVTRINFEKYIGYDLLGKKVLVIINNGELKTIDITGYDYNNGDFFEKEKDDIHTYYTIDENLTKINFEFNDDEETKSVFNTYDNVTYYIINNSGTSTLVYFN